MITPWSLHEAEIALWPAWKDGMPFRGPGAGRDQPLPLLHCKSSLSITETFEDSAATAGRWMAADPAAGSSFQISISFPDGVLADQFTRLLSRMHPGGFRILTVRFFDEGTGHWTLLSFYYVTPATDTLADADQLMSRTVALKSTWMEEEVGDTGMPSLVPAVKGRLDWVCGTQCIPAMTYDPLTETWASTPRNLTGDGSRYITLTPIDENPNSDVILALYLPRVIPLDGTGTALDRHAVNWQNTAAIRVGNHLSTHHHGLALQAGHVLQAAGVVEPIYMLPQSRVLDEPVAIFRYLRRIYATLGHGVFAVPRLLPATPPPRSTDFAFRIAVPGAANPGTGNSGLVLLPDGAWLDGTLLTTP